MQAALLNIALENLSTIPDLMVEATFYEAKSPDNAFYDGELKVLYKNEAFNMPFAVKRKLTAAQLPFIQKQLHRGGILIFEYATKPLKAHLRELHINYIELSGNAFIAHDGIYIFVDTNKRVKLEEVGANAAFSKTGLKVVYHLLNDQEAIGYSYRKLGKLSGVSIDTVGRVYRDLVRDRYLVKFDSKHHQVLDHERLFKDWVTLFNKTLRPKLRKRSFRPANHQAVHDLLTADFEGKVGGELAAEQVSKYNIAEKATIYRDGSFVELAVQLGLRPDPAGSITMIEQFWKDKEGEQGRFVGLPLIYADLVAEPTPRNLETAKLIFDEYACQFV